jgi:integrase
VPAFGNEKLDELTYGRLKGWVIKQAGKYSKDTVRLMVAVLRGMLQEAVNEGILAANPVVKLGKFYRSARRIKEKVDPFTIEELHLIESTCRERFPEYFALVLTLARTGMRIGEVLSLTINDIDIADKKIRLIEGEKNEKGRVVYLSSDSLFALRRWFKIRKKEEAYLFYGLRPDADYFSCAEYEKSHAFVRFIH